MATRAGSVIEPRIVADAHRLLDQAVAIADEGDIVVGNAERLRLYYLAALRAAGAVLVVLESRRRAPRGQRSAWVRRSGSMGTGVNPTRSRCHRCPIR